MCQPPHEHTHTSHQVGSEKRVRSLAAVLAARVRVRPVLEARELLLVVAVLSLLLSPLSLLHLRSAVLAVLARVVLAVSLLVSRVHGGRPLQQRRQPNGVRITVSVTASRSVGSSSGSSGNRFGLGLEHVGRRGRFSGSGTGSSGGNRVRGREEVRRAVRARGPLGLQQRQQLGLGNFVQLVVPVSPHVDKRLRKNQHNG